MMKRRTWKFYAAFTLIAQQLVHVDASAPSANQPGKLTKVEERRHLADIRIDHVREILAKRVEQVVSGKRAKDFARWASKQGDLKILSTHGVDEVDLSITNTTSTRGPTTDSKNEKNKGEPVFSEEKLDLELVPVEEIPSQFPGKPQHLIDDRKANFIELFLRTIKLTINFAPVSMTAWLALFSSSFRSYCWYRWIAACLAASGPAFIKWGQWASTRSDMFPEALCESLAQLHNQSPAHGWSHTEKVMESSLGLPRKSLMQVFEEFDKKPIASGSIAQVHKAKIMGTSQTLAIKVRHPQVARLLDMDFRIMEVAATVADCIPALSWLHVRDTVEQFSSTMAAQAHLNVEGHHLEILNFNFRGWSHVMFPKPIYASSSVIIETFESGRIVSSILDDYDEIADQKGVPIVEEVIEEGDEEGDELDIEYGSGHHVIPMPVAKFMITTGLSIYLKMLLIDNLMHADLHPGNIMFDIELESNPSSSATAPSSSRALVPMEMSRQNEKKLVFTLVDAGMVAQLSKEESTNFIGFLCTLGEGDGRLAGKFALRFSSANKLNPEATEAFLDAMDKMFQKRCRGYHTNVSVGNVLRGVLGVIRDHRVRIDANYATLVVNALCVEGLAERVSPSYNLLDAAKPFLQSYKALCFDKNGNPKDNPSELRKAFVKFSMPMAYLSKKVGDAAFFSKQSRLKQKQRNIQL